mmetsp:Transcript_14737/g.22349  ORF Transcript_14737/g.22349 Transcript_14737/m.22349 type:complete len:286 (+) Transcript_14737:67-924(+)|eukprot:CAMPEP_0167754312 /NCGR_PEP_ID=MMETSP0110_2-20121227/8199_1 /TAXON_ID=629695 /ORGANISM="Gymnochlora sp., Strain CCMP2014" /LENGTH=285 /DNA_ID=CAMNT_0007640175 /DNA_START=43 /DNA_END=900 /DNA_ORIENTATION=-
MERNSRRNRYASSDAETPKGGDSRTSTRASTPGPPGDGGDSVWVRYFDDVTGHYYYGKVAWDEPIEGWVDHKDVPQEDSLILRSKSPGNTSAGLGNTQMPAMTGESIRSYSLLCLSLVFILVVGLLMHYVVTKEIDKRYKVDEKLKFETDKIHVFLPSLNKESEKSTTLPNPPNPSPTPPPPPSLKRHIIRKDQSISSRRHLRRILLAGGAALMGIVPITGVCMKMALEDNDVGSPVDGANDNADSFDPPGNVEIFEIPKLTKDIPVDLVDCRGANSASDGILVD